MSLMVATAAEFWTPEMITAVFAGIGLVIANVVLLMKNSSNSKMLQLKTEVQKTRTEATTEVTIASAQLDFLIRPMREQVEAQGVKMNNLEDETKLLRDECASLRQYEHTVTIYAEYLTALYRWINENVSNPKTPMPDLPFQLRKYMEGSTK